MTRQKANFTLPRAMQNFQFFVPRTVLLDGLFTPSVRQDAPLCNSCQQLKSIHEKYAELAR